MARFKNQVSKGVEPETKNHLLRTRNQKPETSEAEANGLPVYSESDMEAVNVAGFKVPYVVREHWKKACRERRIKLSPMLKEILVEEFGLPPGITPEDL
ncbi:MAG: hypothetical protein WBC73_06010 [Phormidesmis sp.]